MDLKPLERISPVERLLLQTVLLEDVRAVDAFRQWRDCVDIEHIDGNSQRLMPLLARRLEEVGPTDPVRALVRGMYRHAWVKNQLIVRDVGSLAAALGQRGVPALALKGVALVPYYGDDWGSRPMFDVGLCVRVGQLAEAVAVLDEEGWRPLFGRSAEWRLSRVAHRRHSFAFRRDAEYQLNLHWHVLHRSLSRRADDHFWANAVPFDLAGVDVLTLALPHLLLQVMAHGTRKSTPDHMQWVVDAVHILRSTDDPSLAARLGEVADELGRVSTVRVALETIGCLLSEPRVEPLLAQLGRKRPRVSAPID